MRAFSFYENTACYPLPGGSEFMAEFEDACRQRGIKLYLLPPKSPEINWR